MLYKYLLKLNIKCYVIFICFFLINILQAQDCSSLRKPNETYGAGEGKDVSWCNMQNPTAYTDCMCEQEKSQKVSAVEQQNLQKQALNKSTEASALYQQASNLVTQANLDKDPSKLDEAKALYQQAITLSNQAKGFIEQAYAGSDASYNRLKNLYLEQYKKQIAWATTGIEGIPNQKDRIKAETNQKQITLNPKKPSASNTWDLSMETKAENSWASSESSSEKANDLTREDLEVFKEGSFFGVRIKNSTTVLVLPKYYDVWIYTTTINFEERIYFQAKINDSKNYRNQATHNNRILLNADGEVIIEEPFESIYTKTSPYTVLYAGTGYDYEKRTPIEGGEFLVERFSDFRSEPQTSSITGKILENWRCKETSYIYDYSGNLITSWVSSQERSTP